jgi:hypothetical protein
LPSCHLSPNPKPNASGSGHIILELGLALLQKHVVMELGLALKQAVSYHPAN